MPHLPGSGFLLKRLLIFFRSLSGLPLWPGIAEHPPVVGTEPAAGSPLAAPPAEKLTGRRRSQPACGGDDVARLQSRGPFAGQAGGDPRGGGWEERVAPCRGGSYTVTNWPRELRRSWCRGAILPCR